MKARSIYKLMLLLRLLYKLMLLQPSYVNVAIKSDLLRIYESSLLDSLSKLMLLQPSYVNNQIIRK